MLITRALSEITMGSVMRARSFLYSPSGKRNFIMNRKMKTTKSNVTFSLNFVLTIPESKTHPFSLNYDTTRFDNSIRFGPNFPRDRSSV